MQSTWRKFIESTENTKGALISSRGNHDIVSSGSEQIFWCNRTSEILLNNALLLGALNASKSDKAETHTPYFESITNKIQELFYVQEATKKYLVAR